jgi:hypothetical protein
MNEIVALETLGTEEELQVFVQAALQSPGLKRMRYANESVAVALTRYIDIAETPRNLDALWVWSRFLWVFGRRDEWKANGTLSALLTAVGGVSTALRELARLHWWQFMRRRAALLMYRSYGVQLDRLLTECLINAMGWEDAEKMAAYEERARS